MDFSLTTLYVLPSGDLAPDGFKRENLKPSEEHLINRFKRLKRKQRFFKNYCLNKVKSFLNPPAKRLLK